MKCKKYILIINGDENYNKFFNSLLESSYEIIKSSNEKQGIELLNKYCENILAIIIDFSIAKLNNYELMNSLQSNFILKSIPMIVTAENYSEKDEILALTKGACGYISKPINENILKQRIFSIIKLRENQSLFNCFERDMLTGLYNKETFFKKVSEFLKTSNLSEKFDIVCIDIENFKMVNDMFGETEGNKFLTSFANYLNEIVCKMGGISARLYCDVFTIFIPTLNKKEERFFKEFQDYLKRYYNDLKLNIKVGIYKMYNNENLTVRAMCDRAKFASETIKGKYQKHFAYYDDSLRAKLLSQHEIISSMEKAIIEEQFKIYFQPKCYLETEEIIGAEALIRWEHTKKGFLLPSEFIPLFEKNGFITKLDLYVLEKSCQLIRKWIDNNFKIVPISINISRIDIYDLNLPDIISKVVEKYKIPPKYLHFEITESAFTENTKQLIHIVDVLKTKGFVVEMDDFGSGYSSLNMLNQVPFDTIKLDLRFLQGLDTSKRSEEILNFILNLADRLKLSVIAEGIETKDDSNFLMKIGCRYGQGYYFAKPMTTKNFEKIIN